MLRVSMVIEGWRVLLVMLRSETVRMVGRGAGECGAVDDISLRVRRKRKKRTGRTW